MNRINYQKQKFSHFFVNNISLLIHNRVKKNKNFKLENINKCSLNDCTFDFQKRVIVIDPLLPGTFFLLNLEI